MFFLQIILSAIFISSIQSEKPTLKLTFIPDEKYYAHDHPVDISCEIIDPNKHSSSAQLWHVDLRTGKYTAISRVSLLMPYDDGPEMFKQNRNRRIEYIKKNYLRIHKLQLEDSARYDCSCPDCDEDLGKVTKYLQVMKLAEPRWQIEPSGPLREGMKVTIKCAADDFYPYVAHQIIRNHHDITREGKSVTPSNLTYPHQFSWEATITPTDDWHNATLLCIVTQGNYEQRARTHLNILFRPRFRICDGIQHVDSTQSKGIISCSYTGNPQPNLTWFRRIDHKPLTSSTGITIEVKDEHHGRYKSIVTFERDRLIPIPLIRSTSSSSETQPKITGDNYYQQLLNGGFIAKLSSNNEEKDSRTINITPHTSQTRFESIENASTEAAQYIRKLYLILHLVLSMI